MSGYASVAEETRRALASVARLESASIREPSSKALRMNLAAKQKLVSQLRARLLEIAQQSSVEVCNYRLIQVDNRRYGLLYVSESLLEYQHLFTQIHDAKKNGPKSRATYGGDVLAESLLEVGYTYSGSLGVVLLAPSEPSFFGGSLDASIDALFQVVEIDSTPAVKRVASEFGNAVVKRAHDWSAANVRGGFDADVRWSRSDGRQLGQLISRDQMDKIVGIIEASSDTSSEQMALMGTLVGIDLKAGTFHFVVPNGGDFRGALGPAFDRSSTVVVNRNYIASVLETSTTIYSTDQTKRDHTLLSLIDAPSPHAE